MRHLSLLARLSSALIVLSMPTQGWAAAQNATWEPKPKHRDAVKVLVVTGGTTTTPILSVFETRPN